MVWTRIWRLIGFGLRPLGRRSRPGATTAHELFGENRTGPAKRPATTDILDAYLAPRPADVIDLARWRAVRG